MVKREKRFESNTRHEYAVKIRVLACMLAIPAGEVEPCCVDAALGVKRAWLRDGAGLLEAVARLVVPEVDGAVIAAAHGHAVLVHRQSIDRRIVTAEILQKPTTMGKMKNKKLISVRMK